jgi:hypothetical protein
MDQFSSAREAKEFLVSRIVEEAHREGVPLSEVERKMLYFTETGWTLPDMMEISDEFDRDYDQGDYEKKIAHLIRHDAKRLEKENPEEFKSWISAARKLRKEDHYILVMIDQAGVGKESGNWRGGLLVLILVCAAFAIGGLSRYLGLSSLRSSTQFGSYTINERLSNFVGYACLGFIVLALCGLVYSHFDHERRLDRIFDRFASVVLKLFGFPEK